MKQRFFSRIAMSFFALAMLLFTGLNTYAGVAYPYPIKFVQPDGSTLTIRLMGDEFYNKAETVDGYTLMSNKEGAYEYAVINSDNDMVPSGVIAKDAGMRGLADMYVLSTTKKGVNYSSRQLTMMESIIQMAKQRARAGAAFPATGNNRLLCILMGFADKPFMKTKKDFENLFNQVNYSADGATGSVRDFYAENSYGKLNLSVTVVGPYTAAKNMSYYGEDIKRVDDNIESLINEAVKLADRDVNYADFDNDNDGTVECVYVIHAGYGQDDGGGEKTIWPHKGSISQVTLDNKNISTYACSQELRYYPNSGITRIGVICHEFGHALGAPDFYDTDQKTGGQYSGTGWWDVMAGGEWNNDGATPAHHNAYTKVYTYNWATAALLSSDTDVTLKSSETSENSFYRYNTKNKNEYFLVENRQKTGFDKALPGHGMMIYHVHKDLENYLSTNNINATFPQKLYPVCASAITNPGEEPSSYGNINSDGCPFPGSARKIAFTNFTTPCSRSWAWRRTKPTIHNIKESGDEVTFTFTFSDSCTPVENRNDRTLYGDVNGDGRDELIFVNTEQCGGAIRVNDAATGAPILWKNHDANITEWWQNNDKAIIGDVNGDNRDDLILINTVYSEGAIWAIDLLTGETISLIKHGEIDFHHWFGGGDKMVVGDVNGDNKDDLVLVNGGDVGGLIRVINITTGKDIKFLDYDDIDLNTWLGANDKIFLGDVNGDNKDDMVLVNSRSDIKQGAIRAIDIMTGTDLSLLMQADNEFKGWKDASDKMFLGNVSSNNNDGKKGDLIFVNTDYTNGAILVIDIMTGATRVWIDHTTGEGFKGWMDASDKMFIGDVDGDYRDDLVLVNTDYLGSAIRVVNMFTGITIKTIDYAGGNFEGWMDSGDRMRLIKVNADEKADLVLINAKFKEGAIWAKSILDNSTILSMEQSRADLEFWLDGYDPGQGYKTGVKATENEVEESVISDEVSMFDKVVDVFPNPTTGKLNIRINNNDESIEAIQVIGVSGSVIYQNANVQELTELDISNYPSGMYILNVRLNTKVENLKILKK